MKTLDVKTCDDWELVLAVNSPSSVTDLPENVLTEVLVETWKHQDGYGRPGRTPPQGWDFSGIRDSTPRRSAVWRRPSGGCWTSTASGA